VLKSLGAEEMGGGQKAAYGQEHRALPQDGG